MMHLCITQCTYWTPLHVVPANVHVGPLNVHLGSVNNDRVSVYNIAYTLNVRLDPELLYSVIYKL